MCLQAMGRLKPPQKGQVVYKPDFAFFEGVDVALEEVVRATSAAPTFFPGASYASPSPSPPLCVSRLSQLTGFWCSQICRIGKEE